MVLDFMFPVNEHELSRMARVMELQKDDNPRCFAWIAYDTDNISYVDVFIWDNDLPDKYQRYIISTQTYLEESEEKKLLYYASLHVLKMFDVEYDILYSRAKLLYPDIRLKGYDYYKYKPMVLLLHIYYGTHWAYGEEKFFKCGLVKMGLQYREFEGVDEDGKSPHTILGIPMKILRNMNDAECAIDLLKKKAKREALSTLYYNCQGVFTDLIYSYTNGQVLYLEKLMDMERNKINVPEARMILKELDYCHTRSTFDNIWEFLCVREQLKEINIIIPLVYMRNYNIYLKDKYKHILKYKKEEETINNKLQDLLKKYSHLQYENCEFIARFPYSLRDILKTGEQLSNCLYSYVEKLINEQTHVIFIIDKEQCIPIAAMEIDMKEKEIITALGYENNPISLEVAHFIREFNEIKGFRDNSDFETWENYEDEEEWQQIFIT